MMHLHNVCMKYEAAHGFFNYLKTFWVMKKSVLILVLKLIIKKMWNQKIRMSKIFTKVYGANTFSNYFVSFNNDVALNQLCLTYPY